MIQNLKKSFGVLAVAVVAAIMAYAFLSLMAVKTLPAGCNSWTDYISNLGDYSGEASQPTFYTAYTVLGDIGSFTLGAAAFGGIFTGLIGNYIALSRLIDSLAEDGLFPKWLGEKKQGFPKGFPCGRTVSEPPFLLEFSFPIDLCVL